MLLGAALARLMVRPVGPGAMACAGAMLLICGGSIRERSGCWQPGYQEPSKPGWGLVLAWRSDGSTRKDGAGGPWACNAAGPGRPPGPVRSCRGAQVAMRDRACRLRLAGCRRRYHSHAPSAASVPLPRAASHGIIQRLAAGLAGGVGGPLAAGAATAGWTSDGPVAGGVGAGVVVGDAAARTTSVAEAPRFPPPQRPVMV
jgi:hypothetical protein